MRYHRVSPQGHPSLDGPPLGGAGSARLRERLALDRSMSLLGHRRFVRSSVIIPYPRLAPGLARRTHRVRPSEKTALCVIPGFPPKAILASIFHLAEGRAPHARDESPGFIEACPPLGHRPQRLAQEGPGNTLGPHAALRSAHPEDISPRRQAPLPCSRNP